MKAVYREKFRVKSQKLSWVVFDGLLWYNLGMKKMILISLIAFLFAAPMAVADEVDDILKMVPNKPANSDQMLDDLRSANDREGLVNDIMGASPDADSALKDSSSYEAPDFNSLPPVSDGVDPAYVEAMNSRAGEAAARAEYSETRAGLMDQRAAEAQQAGDNVSAEAYRQAADNYRENAQKYKQDSDAWAGRASPTQTKVSILPATNLTVAQCLAELKQVNMKPDDAKEKFGAKDPAQRDDNYVRIILGCAVKTGDIKLWMVPYYVRYILEFVVQLGALAAVGGIVYGGYLYMFAGISEDKDRGKKAIMYSVGGIVIMAVAWAVVNVFISFFI